jgi:hypothetical protein
VSAVSDGNAGAPLVLIMRHARSAGGGRAELPLSSNTISDAARSLAEALHELPPIDNDSRRVSGLTILHEKPDGIARLTAQTFRYAYGAACLEWPNAPQAIREEEFRVTPASPYCDASAAEKWLRESVEAMKKTPSSVVLLVGHDPRIGWLIARLLDGERPGNNLWKRLRYLAHSRRRRALIPGLMHTELIACERRVGTNGFEAVWALSPSDTTGDEAVRQKVKSKMETAKVFAAVLAAAVGLAATQLADAAKATVAAASSSTTLSTTSTVTSTVAAASSSTTLGTTSGVLIATRSAGVAALALLVLSTVLFLVTMFWYDRLLMPTRFWSAAIPSRSNRLARWLGFRHLLRRPPSSSTWVLYQNMQIVWSLCFLRATFFAGLGAVLLALSADGTSQRSVAVLLTIGLLVAVALSWRGRPTLGASD